MRLCLSSIKTTQFYYYSWFILLSFSIWFILLIFKNIFEMEKLIIQILQLKLIPKKRTKHPNSTGVNSSNWIYEIKSIRLFWLVGDKYHPPSTREFSPTQQYLNNRFDQPVPGPTFWARSSNFQKSEKKLALGPRLVFCHKHINFCSLLYITFLHLINIFSWKW